jgi:hypothetical protein
MNIVALGEPFQYTVDPSMKLAPFTIRSKDGPPGDALVGTRGLFRNGTGFAAHKLAAPIGHIRRKAATIVGILKILDILTLRIELEQR